MTIDDAGNEGNVLEIEQVRQNFKKRKADQKEKKRNETGDKNVRKKLPEWIDHNKVNAGVGFHDDTIAVTKETRDLHDSIEIVQIKEPKDTQEQEVERESVKAKQEQN